MQQSLSCQTKSSELFRLIKTHCPSSTVPGDPLSQCVSLTKSEEPSQYHSPVRELRRMPIQASFTLLFWGSLLQMCLRKASLERVASFCSWLWHEATDSCQLTSSVEMFRTSGATTQPLKSGREENTFRNTFRSSDVQAATL